MKQKTLAYLLMAAVAGVAVCAAAVYAFIVPEMGSSLAELGGAETEGYLPVWLWFVELTVLPVAAALAVSFVIALNIRNGRSFCTENARLLSLIAVLAVADGFYYFAGNVVLFFLGMNHPGILLVNLMICFAAFAVSVAAAALSHYARKAAKLQEENDLTI